MENRNKILKCFMNVNMNENEDLIMNEIKIYFSEYSSL